MEVRDYVHYEPITGQFTYICNQSIRLKVGMIPEGIDGRGYRYLRIKGKSYKTARVAFKYMTGIWPDPEVDHRNGNRLDDRWSNLREANSSQQGMNMKHRTDNTSGRKGVSFNKALKK